MITEKKTENLNLITKLSISLYEIDKETERIVIEHDNNLIGIAQLTQALIANANSKTVKETIESMESILYNFKKYTQK
ncbi:hypothetical protein [Capnocytophaga sputigena]|uniref:hypothetical protein n=1 Tax=Capnocytophaga sputigena TaxID=1019 RepID=UPI00288930EB|nr:hypothetical protein [Capnocytophaga sputigena]